MFGGVISLLKTHAPKKKYAAKKKKRFHKMGISCYSNLGILDGKSKMVQRD